MPGKLLPIEPRFWHNVQITPGCWEWTGAKNAKGYGQVGMNGRIFYAHRVAWFLTFGAWPAGIICHSCDNPGCVNTAHMSDGTYKQNGEEASERGRVAFGERSGSARLKSVEVQRIFDLAAKGHLQASIAKELGCNQSNVSRILAGKRRVHFHRETQRQERAHAP